MAYELICARAIGASHVKAGTPCEDYGLKQERKGIKAFVLSDGHGDRSCPRSDRGSRRACEIAADELMTFAEQLSELDASRGDGTGCELLDCEKPRQEAIVRQLVTSIIGKWASDVISSIKEDPLTEEERSGCAQRYLDAYDNNRKLEHIFGATLIAGLVTERYILLLQQGDGRCEVFWDNGSVTQPIPWDERCTANVTTSLCDADAISSTRYHIIDLAKDGVAAVLAGSDGVEDAFFSMDGTHNFYRGLLMRAADTSVQELEDWLTDCLPEFSRNGIGNYGSQDDVTVCGAIDLDKVRPVIAKMEKDLKIASLRSSLKNIDDRLASMGSGKREHLQARYIEAKKEEVAAKAELDSIVENLEMCKTCQGVRPEVDKAKRLELKLFVDGTPILESAGRPIKMLVRSIVGTIAAEVHELESRKPKVERRLAEVKNKIEATRQELQQYDERRNRLLKLRDAYLRELDDLLAEDAIRREQMSQSPEIEQSDTLPEVVVPVLEIAKQSDDVALDDKSNDSGDDGDLSVDNALDGDLGSPSSGNEGVSEDGALEPELSDREQDAREGEPDICDATHAAEQPPTDSYASPDDAMDDDLSSQGSDGEWTGDENAPVPEPTMREQDVFGSLLNACDAERKSVCPSLDSDACPDDAADCNQDSQSSTDEGMGDDGISMSELVNREQYACGEQPDVCGAKYEDERSESDSDV